MTVQLTTRAITALEYMQSASGGVQAFEIDGIEGDQSGPFRMFLLEDAFLLMGGLILGRQGTLIKDCILRDPQISSILGIIAGGAPAVKVEYSRLQGEFVSLTGPWSNGFWHWMMEYLPKALIAEAFGFQGTYILPDNVDPYMTESLQMIGVSTDRLLKWDTACVQLQKLYVPQRFYIDHSRTYLSILRRLRERLLSQVQSSPHPSERVYISRKYAKNGRRVVNEPELIEMLNAFGFQSVFMEQMTLGEQIQLMANAVCLVGATGAGIFHSLVMPPSSCVVELFSPAYTHPCMIPAMDLLHHYYYMVTSRHDGQYPHGRNIEVCLDLVRLTLRNHLHDLKS